MKFRNALVVIVVGIAVLAGCDRDAQTKTEGANGGGGGEALPPGLVLSAAPDGAKGVSEVKKGAVKDQAVVVSGVVAGAKEPIADQRAVFTLADVSLETCDKMPGDTCKTPWDACCAEPSTIAAKSLSVQVAGADGRPLKAGLKDVGGLAPAKQVIVKGKVRSVEGDGEKRVVTIDAEGIHVKG